MIIPHKVKVTIVCSVVALFVWLVVYSQDYVHSQEGYNASDVSAMDRLVAKLNKPVRQDQANALREVYNITDEDKPIRIWGYNGN
jgi:hypothetical protein